VQIDCGASLRFIDSSVQAISGNGGSGGNGGEAVDGNGGISGEGSHGGDAFVVIRVVDDIYIEGTTISVTGGEGGYGGDYGRHEGGTGSPGIPAPGGDGGLATVNISSPGDLTIDNMTVEARAGHGLDGGGGYNQGDTGGDGGEAIIHIHMDDTIVADMVDLKAVGGYGGPGGPAFSDILGNGGNGGDSYIMFTGLMKMDVDHSSIYVFSGTGGIGNKPIYDGADGIPTFDLDTQLLYLSNSTLNMPLDDLHGNARAYLLNVIFDMEFGLHILPIGEAIAREEFPVQVLAVDDPDPAKAAPLEGWKVTVFDTQTGALVAEEVTDKWGMCYFNLSAFEYTSHHVNYLGSYHFIITSPDGKTTKKVRGEIIGPTQIVRMSVGPWSPSIHVTIESPEDGVEYKLNPSKGDHLDVYGYIIIDGEQIDNVRVQLKPVSGGFGDYPVYDLVSSPTIFGKLPEPEDRWGRFFPPEEHSNK
jgi:hypothetical protein